LTQTTLRDPSPAIPPLFTSCAPSSPAPNHRPPDRPPTSQIWDARSALPNLVGCKPNWECQPRLAPSRGGDPATRGRSNAGISDVTYTANSAVTMPDPNPYWRSYNGKSGVGKLLAAGSSVWAATTSKKLVRIDQVRLSLAMGDV
jgi:hypothetical protein